jgi:zinc transport system permease protein
MAAPDKLFSSRRTPMKLKTSLTLAMVILSIAAYTSARAEGHSAQAEHKAAEKHTHKHKKNCGHKAEKHGDHEDFEHDGHHHKAHGDHHDECSGPEHAEPAAKKS